MPRLGGPPTTGAFDAPRISVCVINRMVREDVGGKPWQAPIPEQNDHGNGAAYIEMMRVDKARLVCYYKFSVHDNKKGLSIS